mgnify:FL=1|jgi:hypothetical protein|tara:strand:+ start:32 stop:256 length:225 start_codon:yes stop_codon:yes gene_type:complete
MSKKNLIILAILGTLCLWLWSNSGSVVKTYKIGAVVERFIPDFLYLNLFEKEDKEWENEWKSYLKVIDEGEEDE